MDPDVPESTTPSISIDLQNAPSLDRALDTVAEGENDEEMEDSNPDTVGVSDYTRARSAKDVQAQVCLRAYICVYVARVPYKLVGHTSTHTDTPTIFLVSL